jgi:hypothetical protein
MQSDLKNLLPVRLHERVRFSSEYGVTSLGSVVPYPAVERLASLAVPLGQETPGGVTDQPSRIAFRWVSCSPNFRWAGCLPVQAASSPQPHALAGRLRSRP